MAKPEYKGFDIFDREPGTYNNLTEHQKRCVDELRDENLQARNKVMHLQAENKELEQYVNRLQNSRERLVKQIEERKQEKADLVRTSAAKQSEINQLKADNDTLRQMAQTFAGWYVNAVEEGETLKSKIKGLEDVLEKDHKIISPDTAATMNPEDLVGYRVLDISGRKSAKPKIVTTDKLTDEPTISIKNACVVLNQWADAYQKEVDELKKENETLKAKKSDKLTVTVNAEHIKSELDDLYQEFKELEKSYDALHDVHDELKEHIKGHVERLAYDYDFKEMPNGGGLHYCHDFREIADTVGAKIPNAPFMTARIKAPNVLGDLNNAKIKDLDADKITADAYKELTGEQGVKEYDVKVVAGTDTITSGTINPFIFKTVSDKELTNMIANALKQALDIKSPTEPTAGPPKAAKILTYGDGENDGTESNAQRELNKNQKLNGGIEMASGYGVSANPVKSNFTKGVDASVKVAVKNDNSYTAGPYLRLERLVNGKWVDQGYDSPNPLKPDEKKYDEWDLDYFAKGGTYRFKAEAYRYDSKGNFVKSDGTFYTSAFLIK
ncbi:hypothetical protein PPK16_gp06 [Bacillus phage 049ML001]|uniref:Uncharacterized protein n=1 Tax=Bacillus phage 049ML001 TaxID=2601660 RepID=A0A5P8PI12_9CAUD|nr:hypothetical protein PPK16_gp06 [Bacillus phage 049ML001]QFR56309.1 hypothetical protein 049ML001_6 [Bacillus phage 049ML001]